MAATGTARSPVLPQVPTLDEAGVAGVDVYSWQGVAAPKGLAPDLKQRIHGAIVAALRDPAVADKFTRLGLEVVADRSPAAVPQNTTARSLARMSGRTLIDCGRSSGNGMSITQAR